MTMGFLFTGCPYESDVPLETTPSVKINEALLGTWKEPSYPRDSTYITFKKKSNYEYSVEAFVKGGVKSYSMNRFTCFFTNIANKKVLNARTEEGKYNFVVIELSEKNVLNIKPLNDEITKDKFKTSGEAYQFFSKYLSKDDEYIEYDSDNEIMGLIKNK